MAVANMRGPARKANSHGKRLPFRLQLAAALPLLVASTSAFAQGGRYLSDDAWSFGVTADSQWTISHDLTWAEDDPYYAHVNPDYREENPDYVSVSTILKLNDAFIAHGVSFVVQLGDLTDRAGNAAMYTHAAARQPLFDAGIGFFPVRGNHETYGDLFGNDPDADLSIPAWRDAFPQTQGLGPNIFAARDFNIPDNEALRGLSYSFDYGGPGSGARFVFVDVEATSYRLQDPVPHPIYGLGLQYLRWVIYRHDEAVAGADETEIPPGTWFRIDRTGKPSTDFLGSEEMFPIEDNAQPRQPAPTTAGTSFHPGDQQDWINERLEDSQRPAHAFTLTHRNLLGQNHLDTAWGDDAGVTPEAQNIFYKSLQDNKVGYFLSAHDHMHTRSIVTSPDGSSSIEQLIASSADPKFYSPAAGTMAEQRSRETPISQELNNIGFYIFTVDGSRVSVDYYSDEVGDFGTDYCWPDGFAGPDGTCGDPRSNNPAERLGSLYVPDFHFVKKENWGYGLNGQRFVIPQGISYAGDAVTKGDRVTENPRVRDEFNGTRAEVLDGFNGSESTDNVPDAPRPFAKTVTTGWVENPEPGALKSDVLSLWGMAELGTEKTDTYVLAMSFTRSKRRRLRAGAIGIATYIDGKWVNAVDENFGGAKTFVVGPYVEGRYGLGTYGVDPGSQMAWAVLNYNADFAVAADVH
jgi:hypothetical protein